MKAKEIENEKKPFYLSLYLFFLPFYTLHWLYYLYGCQYFYTESNFFFSLFFHCRLFLARLVLCTLHSPLLCVCVIFLKFLNFARSHRLLLFAVYYVIIYHNNIVHFG